MKVSQRQHLNRILSSPRISLARHFVIGEIGRFASIGAIDGLHKSGFCSVESGLRLAGVASGAYFIRRVWDTCAQIIPMWRSGCYLRLANYGTGSVERASILLPGAST